MFLLPCNLIYVHVQAIYIHLLVCDRGWQILRFPKTFFLKTSIGLRQVFDSEVKLVPSLKNFY